MLPSHDFVVTAVVILFVSDACARKSYRNRNYVHTYSELDEVPMEIPSNARTVWLGGNHILKLRHYTFFYLSHLEHLDVSVNLITEVEVGAFNGLGKLEQLGLNQNKLTEITGSMWTGLEALKGLWLNENEIHLVRKITFFALEEVRLVDT